VRERVIVIDTSGARRAACLINPELIETSGR
jgi:hypothetical protein